MLINPCRVSFIYGITGWRSSLYRIQTGAKDVIYLGGNIHAAEISRCDDEASYPMYDLTSSGLTHVKALYGNATNNYRIDGPYVELNFGQVDIRWYAVAAPEVVLQVLGADGAVMLSRTLSLDEPK